MSLFPCKHHIHSLALSRGCQGKTASEAIRLPTVAEIKAAIELISDTSAKVIQVNKRFTVKWASAYPLIKAKNMKFLATSSKVPVPNVHIAFRNPDTNKTYIIMEYLPGDTLQVNIAIS